LASPSRWRDVRCGCCCPSTGTGSADRVKALKQQQQRVKIHPKGILKYSGKPSYSKFRISKFRILKAKRKNVAKSLLLK